MSIKFIDNNELVIGSSEWTYAPFKFSKILKIGGSGSSPTYEDIVISGNGSVTLTNAKANGLNYVKLFGACEQTQPQTNLLAGFVSASGTGITVSISEDNSIVINGSRTSTSSGYSISTSTPLTLPAGTYTLAVYDKPEGDYTGTQLQFTYSGSSSVKHYIDFGSSETTYTTFTLTTEKTMYARIQVTANTVYDNYIIKPMLVAGSTAPAEYTPIAPNKTYPVAIKCNNGEIKYSPNELNTNDIEIGYYRTSATGALTESPYNFVTGYMPVKPNQSYVFFGRRIADNRLSSYNRIHWFDANKEYVSTNTYTKDKVGTGIVPSNAYFAQCSCNESGATTAKTTREIINGYNWVFELATEEVPYIPYVEGGIYVDGTVETVKDSLNNTATAENLLGLGTTQDVQNITTGDITRNVGVYVFDGTETMATASFSGKHGINITSSTWGAVRDEIPMCNYFRGTAFNAKGYNTCFWHIAGSANNFYILISNNNIDSFRAWLVDMYNAGTPMIVVYKKATATTESVTPQTLTTKGGNNIIEITQASINNLPLEVSYKGVVEEQQGE